MQEDMAGFPRRNEGDRLVISGFKVTVLRSEQPMVLCPCPDILTVEWPDGSQSDVENDNYPTW